MCGFREVEDLLGGEQHQEGGGINLILSVLTRVPVQEEVGEGVGVL